MWQRISQSRFFKVLKNKYFLVTLLFIVGILFFDNNNLLEWGKALKKLSAQKAERDYYKEQIQNTDAQLQQLQSNKDSLEKFAREQYYFHQDNEDVYIVTPGSSEAEDHRP